MGKDTTKDLTKGALLPLILRYTVPLILGSILQLTYNAADSIIVGRYVGRAALAAVGTSNPIMSLLLMFFQGISLGTAVLYLRIIAGGLIFSSLYNFFAGTLPVLLSVHCQEGAVAEYGCQSPGECNPLYERCFQHLFGAVGLSGGLGNYVSSAGGVAPGLLEKRQVKRYRTGKIQRVKCCRSAMIAGRLAYCRKLFYNKISYKYFIIGGNHS